jgi:uncharacterized membrane protein YdjX (TVP38/TMEM64 family)
MTAPIDYESPPPAKPLLPRILVAFAILAMIVSAVVVLRGTAVGHRLMENPRLLAKDVRWFTTIWPVLSVFAFIGLYLLLAELALPVWWLQVLGGIAFGLIYGSVLCLIASSTGAVLTAATSRWLAGDVFHRRIEPKMVQLRQLDRLLGHNGFLVVMTARLTHFLPFGLCNYTFGLLEISFRDIFVGTILGGIPATAVYVALGAGYNPMRNWKFDLIIGSINVLLLVPLALRYMKPEWFKKVGLE